MKRRVIKIGGSLLLRSDLSALVDRWIARQSPAENLLIVGGGELIDAIRRLDHVHALNGDDVHWLCVDLLGATFQIARKLWPSAPFVDDAQSLVQRLEHGFVIQRPTLIMVSCFYRRGCDTVLPNDWRTTSDAIAAHLGMMVGADEVVLLKSCAVDATAGLDRLVADGVVDASLPLVGLSDGVLRVESLATT
ncbi:Amino acid kinase family protein [Rubripirellula tenax]|uniref:Amino acid kinase family protein n=1 Tax=Rubripirellula tenax TaxID=2528015 RepID=A0A5C6EFC8_9BACT|nr:protein kinase [Rubripirellula tenax]TWU47498.1 Amino acid kinase family protein [Rubripirellula tenax]